MYHKNSYNIVILAGNVGKAPVIKSAKGKSSYQFGSFGLKTTEVFKGGEEREHWHNIVAGGPTLTKLCKEHIEEGMRLLIEGRLINNTITQKDGTKRTFTNVRAGSIIFMCPKTKREQRVSDDEDEFFDQSPAEGDDEKGMW